MSEQQIAQSAPPAGVAVTTLRWVSGILFVLGLLGLLRRHFDGFFSAPGVSTFGFVITPFGALLLFVLAILGISALRPGRGTLRALMLLASGCGVGALIGAAAGPDADGLAMNGRMSLLLALLGVWALVAALVGQRVAAADLS